MNEPDNLIYINGIDGDTGEYSIPPLTPQQIADVALGDNFYNKKDNELELSELKEKHDPGVSSRPMEGVDPKNLSETGWGVIFAHNTNPAVREALGELLEHRQRQATQKHEHYYQEYIGWKGYRPGESKNDFLARHKVGPGPADPDKMPYYLLIVGDPETIPYRFQYQLDVQYAVGRIYFDKLEDYAYYARSVVTAETGKLSLPRQIGFFGVRNPGDMATQLTADRLIKPLSEIIAEEHTDWRVQTVLAEEATKARLSQMLGGSETPAVLFTGSHGMDFSSGSPRQIPHQGALICQEWSPRRRGAIPADFYFSADDVGEDARVFGAIAFHFACYGAGTPKLDDFAHIDHFRDRPGIADRAFVARLPQRLLSHPRGGALAIVGHVERAWSSSFLWGGEQQLPVFESSLKRLLEGHPIGSAFEFFDERYAELSSDLTEELENIKYGKALNPIELSNMWTANNDARAYAIVGDPAVRLAVGSDRPWQTERPTIEQINLQLSEPTAEPSGISEFQAEEVRRVIQGLENFVRAMEASSNPQLLEGAIASSKDLIVKLKAEIE